MSAAGCSLCLLLPSFPLPLLGASNKSAACASGTRRKEDSRAACACARALDGRMPEAPAGALKRHLSEICPSRLTSSSAKSATQAPIPQVDASTTCTCRLQGRVRSAIKSGASPSQYSNSRFTDGHNGTSCK